ncbi:class I SAM-dependent methyltransferase [Actinomycetospora cinnamomea]|uniref:Putative SAM-dependent methyltransferase n=1 Tax=Actinomycetospora cinnamomea TaxID=663609 RepID=A0A2U1EXH7_9PSEU|nr:class I SAM-dependent methyltransferase [Actinomycetospora cinnamomea]PVZ04609.1 putative SAM-dependent methyltransferase [Actinomycetospora cinnamomea]
MTLAGAAPRTGDGTRPVPAVVTTSKSPSYALRAEAHRLGARWGLPVVERHRGSVAAARGSAATALVCTSEGLVAESARGRLSFHQGTAAKRLRTVRHGGTDPLVRAGELRPGDRVLDATLGLGRDALVAAWAVGAGGQVFGIEADLVLAVLADAGFAGPVPRPGSAPVRVRHGDSRQVLTAMAAAGEHVDVVLLDPMFTDPRASDHGFALAREHTVPTPLTPTWIELARAVARRRVVVTAERARPWFADAGLERLEGTRSGRWFRAPGGVS